MLDTSMQSSEVTSKPILIPKDREFGSPAWVKDIGTREHASNHADKTDASFMLDVCRAYLGISWTSLGVMIGLPFSNLIYRYKNGGNRLSSRYLNRLMFLVMEKSAGRFKPSDLKTQTDARKYWTRVAGHIDLVKQEAWSRGIEVSDSDIWRNAAVVQSLVGLDREQEK